jgi:NitT/TauT family transport system ATP-binding protein
MLEFDHVGVVYPGSARMESVEALRDICVAARQGEFLTLIGPSGCGKSTLLNLAAGLRRATRGRVLVGGGEVRGPQPATAAIVFQDYTLFPWRTVQANAEVGLEFRGVPKRQRQERARHYLRMVGLEAFAQAYPRQLSGGMRQRVALARALSLETPLLLLDEPFGALDEQTRTVLGEEVSNIYAQTRKTVLLVTHSLAEAVFLSDRIAVMTRRPGRIRELIEVPAPQPRTPEFMTDRVFHDIRDHLFHLLHDEMRAAALSTEAG